MGHTCRLSPNDIEDEEETTHDYDDDDDTTPHPESRTKSDERSRENVGRAGDIFYSNKDDARIELGT